MSLGPFNRNWFVSGMAAGFALCLSIVIVLAAVVDYLFLGLGDVTISYRILAVGYYYPFAAAMVGFTAGVVAGALIGHFFLPQVVKSAAKPSKP